MRIGYCTWTNPYDKKSWSGLHYYIMKALEKCGEVIPLGPLDNRFVIWGKIINKLSKKISGRQFAYMHSPFIAYDFARRLKKKIAKHRIDLLFFSGGSFILAYLDVNNPILYLTDATFKSMIDYYPSFSNLLKISIKYGMQIETMAIKKSNKVICSSKWTAESVIKDYGCSKDKVYTIPFGANMDMVPSKNEIVSGRKNRRAVCKLLFVGVDWIRKGGKIAFETMVELNRRGINTELVVCGVNPPKDIQHEKMRVVGFLDKNYVNQNAKLQQLYLESSIFILPTRNECVGIVYCESAAYGLPVISTYTGGVPSYVKDGANGYLLALNADYHNYADTIQKIWSDKEEYYTLCKNSRDKYENELNWDKWSNKVKEIIHSF